MAYARINHTGVHKGRVQIVIAMYLEPSDPNYEKHHVYIPVFPESGYPGGVDKDGKPKSQADFDAWKTSLPHVWQNNPFHNHCIYADPTTDDTTIKKQVTDSFNYFYTFHQNCWDNNIEFLNEWSKVPVAKEAIRCPFVKGGLTEVNERACLVKAQDILERVLVFEIKEVAKL